MTVLDAPPEGYIPLADLARRLGCHPRAAANAARRGDVPGAVRCRVLAQPRPVWFVPADCPWRPRPEGWPRGVPRKK